jgi:hypothetical protein
MFDMWGVRMTISEALDTGTLSYSRAQALCVDYVEGYDLGRLDMLIDLLSDPLAITDNHTRDFLRLAAENICEGLKDAGVFFWSIYGDVRVYL